MPLSASLAARITRVSLAAISRGDLEGDVVELVARDDPVDRAELCQLGGRDRRRGEVERRIMCCGTSRAMWVAAPSAPWLTSGTPK